MPPKRVWVYAVPLKGSSKNTGCNDFCLHYSHPGPASNDVLHFEEASPNTFYTLRLLCLRVSFCGRFMSPATFRLVNWHCYEML